MAIPLLCRCSRCARRLLNDIWQALDGDGQNARAWHVMPCHDTPLHARPPHVMPRPAVHGMACHGMPWQVMPDHACHAMAGHCMHQGLGQMVDVVQLSWGKGTNKN